MNGRRLKAGLALSAAVTASTLLVAAPTSAKEIGRIAEVKVVDGRIQALFQVDGLADGVRVDPESVVVRVDGKIARPSEATPVKAESPDIKRIAILAIDNSRSMIDGRLDAAKQAATTFLDALSPDVSVGLVVFGDTAEVVIPRTSDRGSVRAAVEALVLDDTTGTALFDAAATASDASGADGARSVLLLTDGNEDGSSERSVEQAIGSATDDDVSVDAVYIGAEAEQPAELRELVEGAGGQVVTSDPAGLAAVFEQAAQAISNQLVVTAELPEGTKESGNVQILATAAGIPVADTAFATLREPAPRSDVNFGPQPLNSSTGSLLLDESALPAVLGALFLGLLILLYVALSSFRRDDKQGRVRRRLSIYTLTGRTPVKQEETTTALGSSQVARSAVELAGRVVRRRDFESGLTLKLEAAGVPLRPAEWMLIHVGIAIGSALLTLLISGGAILPTILGLALGLGLPFGYLTVKESRRTSAFLGQLPDTLQLIAGSLSAGYSMPQAMDTVVREGSQPVTSEFNRALVEARLGVPIEDAMDGIADRMQSKDFAWVVMAIRIQREVGGNLAELLTTVSATLRERERLRRQVKVLSAEGRLSAWILGLLPVVFALYLVLVQPDYLRPLVSEVMGWLMIAMGVTLLAVGALWMRKAVKVEV